MTEELNTRIRALLEGNDKSPEDPIHVWEATLYLRSHPFLDEWVSMTVEENHFGRFVPHGIAGGFETSTSWAYTARLSLLTGDQIAAILYLAKVKRDSPKIYSKLLSLICKGSKGVIGKGEIPSVKEVFRHIRDLCLTECNLWEEDTQFQSHTELPYNLDYKNENLALVDGYHAEQSRLSLPSFMSSGGSAIKPIPFEKRLMKRENPTPFEKYFKKREKLRRIKSDLVCFNCQKKGHYKSECPELFGSSSDYGSY